MKLIIFLIIVVILYFVATQIKVFHVDTLSREQRTELENRSKIRSMLVSNHIKCKESSDEMPLIKNESKKIQFDFPSSCSRSIIPMTDKSFQSKMEHFVQNLEFENGNSTDKINDKINYSATGLTSNKNINTFLKMIKYEYLDTQYKFNIATLPVTSRSPNKNTEILDKKYLRHIKKNIENWNEIFDHHAIIVKHIKPIFIQETENEFIIYFNPVFWKNKVF